MTRLEDYKGYAVTVNSDGEFSANKIQDGFLETTVTTAETLKDLKQKIDSISKMKMGQSVYTLKSFRYYKHGKITSISSKRNYSGHQYYRVVFDDKGWCEVTASELLKDVEHNKDGISKLQRLEKQKEKIFVEMDMITSNFERYTDKELQGK